MRGHEKGREKREGEERRGEERRQKCREDLNIEIYTTHHISNKQITRTRTRTYPLAICVRTKYIHLIEIF